MLLEWGDWEPQYMEIVQELGLDSEADHKATEVLCSLVAGQNPAPLLDKLEALLTGKDVVICGAGPSLERHLKEIEKQHRLSSFTVVAADGAASALLEGGHRCDILVTDLDGRRKDLEEVVRRGAIPIVHAHGDNMPLVKEIVPRLGHILGSTQVRPTGNVFLWGGFTDGDRACHIAVSYRPRRLVLAGMDFGRIVGHWSKPDYQDAFQAGERKRAKLVIARRLIQHLLEQSDIDYTLMS
ncbi:MAG: DUF115 domain-containing protein [Candidatus Thorarchaeota archaeon]|nr:DUF115 domain-containing protein [Candidatus Thorarchaeota archaeon]